MGDKRRFGLLGRKLGHSYSPAIHSCLGEYEYALYEQEPEDAVCGELLHARGP